MRNRNAKFEYLYYDLGKVDNTIYDGLVNFDAFLGEAAIKGNIVRVGLNYKFSPLR